MERLTLVGQHFFNDLDFALIIVNEFVKQWQVQLPGVGALDFHKVIAPR